MEEALEDFPGALVLVTHDRAMLDRLATEVLALDGRGGSAMVASVDQAVALERKAERERSVSESKPSPVAPQQARAAPQVRRKLSYNEQREYDAMERNIAEAEALVASAEKRVSDPSVASDLARMTRACAELSDAQALVARLYARWEELEAKLA